MQIVLDMMKEGTKRDLILLQTVSNLMPCPLLFNIFLHSLLNFFCRHNFPCNKHLLLVLNLKAQYSLDWNLES